MKKLLALTLTVVFLLALIGCNDTSNIPNAPEATTPEVTTPEVTTPSSDQPASPLKEIDRIVDLTETENIPTGEELEYFYKDTSYYYIFASIKSSYVMVYYKDGTSENVKIALEAGHITITDLTKFDILYFKEVRNDLSKLTMESLTELVSTHGEELSWAHLEQYYFFESGSGLYIRVYEINDNYQLWIGGPGPLVEPYYVYLIRGGNLDDCIDVRYENIHEFITKE